MHRQREIEITDINFFTKYVAGAKEIFRFMVVAFNEKNKVKRWK